MTRFFFVETSEWFVDPSVAPLPQAANIEPNTLLIHDADRRPVRFQKKMEVKDGGGRTTAYVTVRSTNKQTVDER